VIAVDTNILVHLLLPGTHSEQAAALRQRDPEWVAPFLWRSEFRSVLQKYLRTGLLTLPQARARQAEAELLMLGREIDVDSAAVLEFAHRSGCTTYDCEFVAVAESLKISLVTLDAAILKAFPRRATPLGAAI
jgi:predicted nucleic acid-binding protein